MKLSNPFKPPASEIDDIYANKNNSGGGNAAIPQPEIKDLSWEAVLLNRIWGIVKKRWIGVLLGAFLLFVAYKATMLYSGYGFATHLSECTSLESFCELAKRKASNREVTSAMGEAFSCAKNKQSTIEAFFIPIPQQWSSPPPESLSYRDVEKRCKKK